MYVQEKISHGFKFFISLVTKEVKQNLVNLKYVKINTEKCRTEWNVFQCKKKYITKYPLQTIL